MTDILLRIYFDGMWKAEYLVGCDTVTHAVPLWQAFLLEMVWQ
jgi:hypothetical protein